MSLPSGFSTTLQAEQALNSASNDSLVHVWQEEFAAVEHLYARLVSASRLRWWRRIGRLFKRPVPTYKQYIHSTTSADGVVGLIAYLSALKGVRDRQSLRRDIVALADGVARLDRLSAYVVAPQYQAVANRVRNIVTLLKTQHPEVAIDHGAIDALAQLVGEGRGYAVDEPDWSDHTAAALYIEPDHVAHRLVDQIDRMEAFYGELAADSESRLGSVHTPAAGVPTDNNPPTMDANSLQVLRSAKTLMENGVLGILKAYWGIALLPVSIGEPFNSETMVCDGAMETNDRPALPGIHVAKVIKPGFTYNHGRIFRVAHVLVFAEA